MTSPRHKRGFTLMELLVVMAIIGLLASASLPAITSLTSSFNLTGSTNNFVGALSYARQQAIALNCQVEVRFYQYVDPEFSNEPAEGNYHAYQLYADTDSGGKPLNRVQFLPGRLIFSPDEVLSALLVTGCPNTVVVKNTNEKNLPDNYNIRVFHFKPNGSTDINSPADAPANFVTLADFASLTKAGVGAAPPNYATIVIDTVSGTPKVLRPGG